MELLQRKRELILQLKQYREEHGLSCQRIVDIVCEYAETHNSDDYVSLSTIKRIFREGSEDDDSFNYDQTIRPIASALLGLDSLTPKAHDKELSLSLLRYKNERIQHLERQLVDERAQTERRIAFLTSQIDVKDKYLQEKDRLISMLIESILNGQGTSVFQPRKTDEEPLLQDSSAY